MMTHRSLLSAFCLLWLPATAFAYVDPGSGMLFWQGLIALIGALLVFARHPMQSIRKLIERWRGK